MNPELRAQLRARRARVLERIALLERAFEDIVEHSSDAARDDEHDPEGATIGYERAQVTALLRGAQAQLADVDLALRRLDAGEHDTCEVCGGRIPPERHEIRPEARRCVGCVG